jgi:hypothetical protein
MVSHNERRALHTTGGQCVWPRVRRYCGERSGGCRASSGFSWAPETCEPAWSCGCGGRSSVASTAGCREQSSMLCMGNWPAKRVNSAGWPHQARPGKPRGGALCQAAASRPQPARPRLLTSRCIVTTPFSTRAWQHAAARSAPAPSRHRSQSVQEGPEDESTRAAVRRTCHRSRRYMQKRPAERSACAEGNRDGQSRRRFLCVRWSGCRRRPPTSWPEQQHCCFRAP